VCNARFRRLHRTVTVRLATAYGIVPTVSSALSLSLAPAPSALVEVAAAVEGFCEAEAVPPRQSYALSLAFEELLTNVVNHGYAGRDTAGERMTVELRREGTRVLARIEDGGVAFDPTAAPDVDLDLDLEERRIGGLGVHLVRTLVDELAYRRQDGRNVITFSLSLTARDATGGDGPDPDDL
jgi:serine/threonine-protein kinase RsbW